VSTGRVPLAVVRAGIAVATRLLPSAATRARYRAEFAAELYMLGGVAQVWFTVGVLSKALALRVALSPPSIPWRCRILRWHVWERRSTADGGRYAVCHLCGTDLGAAGLGPMTTPPWPGRR
jgi:hypothetical protein